MVTSIGYLQLLAAAAICVRRRRPGPLPATAALVAAETVQYFAGLAGALWLHIPLGVLTVTGLVVQFAAAWREPLRRRVAGDA
ncbi:hypothetical protein [Dactylosporangium sp. CA-139066]|uniref:hypothetical protein n=1 Tax=Dactylosporangium sp. CA-139066 TaxID=3239930 RepID=UPI003D8D8BD8